jgi:Common central domain of tyrosinase/Polyphenol oxidase middle domain
VRWNKEIAMGFKGNVRISILIVTATICLFANSACPGPQQNTAGQTAGPQVRMRWEDFISGPDGAKRLASLEAAVTKMKSLDNSPPTSADYRRSWAYWANIHGYYGPQSLDGTVEEQIQYLQQNQMGQYVSYYQGITDQTPPDATATTVWATCQHSGQTQALNFFGWHRMYLYYFERVLRWASGDNTLRLPYWDYTDPAQVALPAEFQSSTSILYDAKRDPGMNSGTSTLDPSVTNVNSLLRDSDYFDYEGKIESGIHGYVHCTTGPTCPVAYMGDVPVAGNDPIFYSHHANIDRLWACWQKLYPTPAGSWQDQTFSFVDETGTLQTQPVKNFLDSTTLGYVYDNASSCARAGAMVNVPRTIPQAIPPETGPLNTALLAASKTVNIIRSQTTVDIEVPQAKRTNLFAQPEGSATTELVLRDITAQTHPGVLFDVYLAKKGDASVRKLVGTISWFGAFRHHGSQGPEKKTLHFDVTDQLRELGGTKDTSGLTVTIEATQGRVPADPSKAESMRASAAKAFRPQAKLQIGAIELRQATVAPEPEKR